MHSTSLLIFTRTPLHIGAGASVGAIDQPVQRERHTGFPIIPATSMKGSFADQWPATHDNGKGSKQRLATESREVDGQKKVFLSKADEGAWLFGSDTTALAFAGSLMFSEARVLAFPIRSAKGSYAWITCPLMLQRAVRDRVLQQSTVAHLTECNDDSAIFIKGGKLDVQDGQIVLEEYCFKHAGEPPVDLSKALSDLIPDDLFGTIIDRLVILSNGMMSHFATNACEVAQHVRISDETGTADGGGLFNQENVPADTLFYAVLNATQSRVPEGELSGKTAEDAINVFGKKITEIKVFQFGGDASTGLGYCTVILK
jgi:CRISPR-associated protein Cmr4